MANFRVETAFDPKNGLIYAELYFPEDSVVPLARTGSIYPTHEAAEKDVIAMFVAALPAK